MRQQNVLYAPPPFLRTITTVILSYPLSIFDPPLLLLFEPVATIINSHHQKYSEVWVWLLNVSGFCIGAYIWRLLSVGTSEEVVSLEE